MCVLVRRRPLGARMCEVLKVLDGELDAGPAATWVVGTVLGDAAWAVTWAVSG